MAAPRGAIPGPAFWTGSLAAGAISRARLGAIFLDGSAAARVVVPANYPLRLSSQSARTFIIAHPAADPAAEVNSAPVILSRPRVGGKVGLPAVVPETLRLLGGSFGGYGVGGVRRSHSRSSSRLIGASSILLRGSSAMVAPAIGATTALSSSLWTWRREIPIPVKKGDGRKLGDDYGEGTRNFRNVFGFHTLNGRLTGLQVNRTTDWIREREVFGRGREGVEWRRRELAEGTRRSWRIAGGGRETGGGGGSQLRCAQISKASIHLGQQRGARWDPSSSPLPPYAAAPTRVAALSTTYSLTGAVDGKDRRRLDFAVSALNTAVEEGSHTHEVVPPPDEFVRNALISSREQYENMYERSIADPDGFWAEIASQFYWKEKWDDVAGKVHAENFDVRKGPISVQWFKGGKTNICYNALDRHVEEGRGSDDAFIWEGNDVGRERKLTYSEVLEQVCQLANYLRSIGVKKGDRVTIYMPMLPELPMAMLACARIGVVHSVVFGGFSAESLAGRIMDAESKVVLTASAVKRAHKKIDLKSIADKAVALCQESGFNVETLLVYDNGNALARDQTPWTAARDVWWQDAVSQQEKTCDVEWVDAEDPLFMLYTSGSTGKPKGVLHTTGGYMVYAATTFKYVFDYRRGDVFWCTADCGWITGHSYVAYGPLLNGATCLVFEGVPTYPDAGRCWEIVDKHKVSIFYTAPTAIRSLERAGNQWGYILPQDPEYSNAGAPEDTCGLTEQRRWYHDVVGDGRCPIVDTWWQTETGAILIAPLPGAWPQKPGSATLPFFGVEPVIVDENGNELDGECSGVLCLKAAWPGMMRTLYNEQERFEMAYFTPYKGYYFTGDGCRRDKDGYYWLTGRVDDVINVSGHRIGTAEVESALESHPLCAEAAVVGYDHEVKGQGIYAFVSLMEGTEYNNDLRTSLVGTVREQIGPFAAPDKIHLALGLPKTRSGKIMRRILRKIASNETTDQMGDISTLADPSVVEELIRTRAD
ncbi:hypothetical protein CBR_g19652 [Chara braunii]|uniref:acetate--CoA ligase n=1 Tax=Chara braunii TaxID=69332 RepID=A0A388KYL0_CHABU|nr:hypothetical protein CBR_g19652 [Chara braunii]|eukprot:GBG75139.1 hypothetical protein CBR_g19652 [Chara braunii]